MKKALVLATALFSTTLFTGALLAHDSASAIHPKLGNSVTNKTNDLISISEALPITSEVTPAIYNNIELLPGKADNAYYLIEGLSNGQERFAILNAKTGQNATQHLVQPQSPPSARPLQPLKAALLAECSKPHPLLLGRQLTI